MVCIHVLQEKNILLNILLLGAMADEGIHTETQNLQPSLQTEIEKSISDAMETEDDKHDKFIYCQH